MQKGLLLAHNSIIVIKCDRRHRWNEFDSVIPFFAPRRVLSKGKNSTMIKMRIITDQTRTEIKKILAEIHDGTLAKT